MSNFKLFKTQEVEFFFSVLIPIPKPGFGCTRHNTLAKTEIIYPKNVRAKVAMEAKQH